MNKIRNFLVFFILISFCFVGNVNAECASIDDDVIKEISEIFYLIGYIALTIGIILGMLDFFKVLASGDNGELKKVAQKFVKRLLAIALFFVIPTLTKWILDLAGYSNVDTCIEKTEANVCHLGQVV